MRRSLYKIMPRKIRDARIQNSRRLRQERLKIEDNEKPEVYVVRGNGWVRYYTNEGWKDEEP